MNILFAMIIFLSNADLGKKNAPSALGHHWMISLSLTAPWDTTAFGGVRKQSLMPEAKELKNLLQPAEKAWSQGKHPDIELLRQEQHYSH